MKIIFDPKLLIYKAFFMQNIPTKFYLINCSYAERSRELIFIKDLLARFSNEELTGITAFVNNNPYNLEFLLLLIFEKSDEAFDNWIATHYPEKKVSYLFNYTLDDIVSNSLDRNRYAAYSFSTFEQIQKILTEEANEIFLFHSLKVIEQKWGKIEKLFKRKVFLSYSSKDKAVAEKIFGELQKEEVKTWFDKIEVDYGDCITDRLNDGLKHSDVGLLCFSKNFLNSAWPRAEMNYFFRQRMVSGKTNFIILNIDLELSDFPPLLQDYRYIDLKNENWLEELILRIKKETE